MTPAAFSVSARAGPDWTISFVPTTSAAPEAKASQTSSTEASNATENPWKTRSVGPTRKISASARTRWQALRCSI